MKKTIFSIFIFVTFISTCYLVYINFFKTTEIWKTYEKNNDQIKSHQSTKAELSIVSPSHKVKRLPASINENTYKGRKLIVDKDIYNLKDHNFEIINTVNKNWKEILSNNLLRFQDIHTKVFIKEEKSIFKIQNFKGKYLEKVTISFLLPNGRLNSANALIDPSNGKIINTWNHTKHMAHDHIVKLTPTNIKKSIN